MLLEAFGEADEPAPSRLRARVADDRRGARTGSAAWAAAFDGDVAIVSNEVGMGLVPPYPLGRVFRDALGAANRVIAARADRAYFLVAGLALELKALGAIPRGCVRRDAAAHDPDHR